MCAQGSQAAEELQTLYNIKDDEQFLAGLTAWEKQHLEAAQQLRAHVAKGATACEAELGMCIIAMAAGGSVSYDKAGVALYRMMCAMRWCKLQLPKETAVQKGPQSNGEAVQGLGKAPGGQPANAAPAHTASQPSTVVSNGTSHTAAGPAKPTIPPQQQPAAVATGTGNKGPAITHQFDQQLVEDVAQDVALQLHEAVKQQLSSALYKHGRGFSSKPEHPIVPPLFDAWWERTCQQQSVSLHEDQRQWDAEDAKQRREEEQRLIAQRAADQALLRAAAAAAAPAQQATAAGAPAQQATAAAVPAQHATAAAQQATAAAAPAQQATTAAPLQPAAPQRQGLSQEPQTTAQGATQAGAQTVQQSPSTQPGMTQQASDRQPAAPQGPAGSKAGGHVPRLLRQGNLPGLGGTPIQAGFSAAHQKTSATARASADAANGQPPRANGVLLASSHAQGADNGSSRYGTMIVPPPPPYPPPVPLQPAKATKHAHASDRKEEREDDHAPVFKRTRVDNQPRVFGSGRKRSRELETRQSENGPQANGSKGAAKSSHSPPRSPLCHPTQAAKAMNTETPVPSPPRAAAPAPAPASATAPATAGAAAAAATPQPPTAPASNPCIPMEPMANGSNEAATLPMPTGTVTSVSAAQQTAAQGATHSSVPALGPAPAAQASDHVAMVAVMLTGRSTVGAVALPAEAAPGSALQPATTALPTTPGVPAAPIPSTAVTNSTAIPPPLPHPLAAAGAATTAQKVPAACERTAPQAPTADGQPKSTSTPAANGPSAAAATRLPADPPSSHGATAATRPQSPHAPSGQPAVSPPQPTITLTPAPAGSGRDADMASGLCLPLAAAGIEPLASPFHPTSPTITLAPGIAGRTDRISPPSNAIPGPALRPIATRSSAPVGAVAPAADPAPSIAAYGMIRPQHTSHAAAATAADAHPLTAAAHSPLLIVPHASSTLNSAAAVTPRLRAVPPAPAAVAAQTMPPPVDAMGAGPPKPARASKSQLQRDKPQDGHQGAARKRRPWMQGELDSENHPSMPADLMLRQSAAMAELESARSDLETRTRDLVALDEDLAQARLRAEPNPNLIKRLENSRNVLQDLCAYEQWRFDVAQKAVAPVGFVPVGRKHR